MFMTDAPVETTLGGRIQHSRTYHGLTVPQLARRLGVKAKTLENWEANRTTKTSPKICSIFVLNKIHLSTFSQSSFSDQRQAVVANLFHVVLVHNYILLPMLFVTE